MASQERPNGKTPQRDRRQRQSELLASAPSTPTTEPGRRSRSVERASQMPPAIQTGTPFPRQHSTQTPERTPRSFGDLLAPAPATSTRDPTSSRSVGSGERASQSAATPTAMPSPRQRSQTPVRGPSATVDDPAAVPAASLPRHAVSVRAAAAAPAKERPAAAPAKKQDFSGVFKRLEKQVIAAGVDKGLFKRTKQIMEAGHADPARPYPPQCRQQGCRAQRPLGYPAEDMYVCQDHRVVLSQQILKVLRRARNAFDAQEDGLPNEVRAALRQLQIAAHSMTEADDTLLGEYLAMDQETRARNQKYYPSLMTTMRVLHGQWSAQGRSVQVLEGYMLLLTIYRYTMNPFFQVLGNGLAALANAICKATIGIADIIGYQIVGGLLRVLMAFLYVVGGVVVQATMGVLGGLLGGSGGALAVALGFSGPPGWLIGSLGAVGFAVGAIYQYCTEPERLPVQVEIIGVRGQLVGNIRVRVGPHYRLFAAGNAPLPVQDAPNGNDGADDDADGVELDDADEDVDLEAACDGVSSGDD